MKYLATIKQAYDTSSKMFNSIPAAEQWLDENNNNLEHTTIIEEFDDNWRKVGSFIYTEGKQQ